MDLARLHYANAAKTKGFEFKHYKHEDVRAALRKMFDRFCAYCESDYACATPPDIEHFRPKSAFLVPEMGNGKPKLRRPGYWWLAASWDNLLLSCPGCNRVWTQDVRSIKDVAKDQLSGKGNWFPLEDESVRASSVGGEVRERPLLVDPCVDDPSQHFLFHSNGMVDWLTKKGEESVRVYGLARDDLTRSREEHAIAVKSIIANLKFRVRDFNPESADPFREINAELRNLDRLRAGRYKATTAAVINEDPDFPQLLDACRKGSTEHRAFVLARAAKPKR